MSSTDDKPEQPRMVKWSPPYRRENVEMPEFDLIEIERDAPIGRIVLNSPEKRNPLGYERLLQIEMAAKLLELDDSIRVIIIKGQGPSFCAGYDITPVKKGERQRNMPPGGYIHPERDRLWQSYDLEHARVYSGKVLDLARIEAGEIGDVVLVKSHTRGPSKPRPWMYDIAISNGPLAEVSSHDIEREFSRGSTASIPAGRASWAAMWKAMVVLPVPLGPVNRMAWATRSDVMALAMVRVTCSC